MKKCCRRLKIKTFLLGSAGIFAAIALMLLLGQVLQAPFTRLFVQLARSLFDMSREEALRQYENWIGRRAGELAALGSAVIVLLGIYCMTRYLTRRLEQVGSAIQSLAADADRPVTLPGGLHPVEAELETLRSRLRQQAAAARESEQRKQDLISFLAHDLKTPLTSVVGYLNLLRDKPDMEAQQRAKYTGIALDKAERLEELLGEFFDITRMDLQRGEDEMAPIQITFLLEQLADEFYPIFAEKSLTCETDIQRQLVVLGEADKLARVFDNILRNAVSYSTPGGCVRVQAVGEGEQVVVTVSNQGLEIPEEELSRIFQKFYRLDAARSTRTGGAGLGLAIAKEIVELHQGTIRAESDGALTSFVITLPRYVGEEE